MDKDTIRDLRNAQRDLDKALARRRRASKALDDAEQRVREARTLAETIGRTLQQELDLLVRPGATDTAETEGSPIP